MAAARAALVEKERVKKIRVEQPAVQMLRAAAWSAMKKQRGYTIAPADLLDVDPMPVAHLEHTGIERAQRVCGWRIDRPSGAIVS